MATGKFVGREEAMKRLRIIPRIIKSSKILSVNRRESPKVEIKREAKVEEEVKRTSEAVVKGMTEAEKRLADVLEARQEEKALEEAEDSVAEDQAGATEPYDDPEFKKEQEGFEPIAEEPRKKKRGRRGRRGRA